MAWGNLNLQEIYLESDITGTVKVFRGNRELKSVANRDGRSLTVKLANPIKLKVGQPILVQIGLDHPA